MHVMGFVRGISKNWVLNFFFHWLMFALSMGYNLWSTDTNTDTKHDTNTNTGDLRKCKWLNVTTCVTVGHWTVNTPLIIWCVDAK